jgi:hypothetical protein
MKTTLVHPAFDWWLRVKAWFAKVPPPVARPAVRPPKPHRTTVFFELP